MNYLGKECWVVCAMTARDQARPVNADLKRQGLARIGARRVHAVSTRSVHSYCTTGSLHHDDDVDEFVMSMPIPGGMSSGGNLFGFSLASQGRLRSTFASLPAFTDF